MLRYFIVSENPLGNTAEAMHIPAPSQLEKVSGREMLLSPNGPLPFHWPLPVQIICYIPWQGTLLAWMRVGP